MDDTLIAYDYSGSTRGISFYHKFGERIVNSNPNAQLMLWNHNYIIDNDRKKFKNIIKNQ